MALHHQFLVISHITGSQRSPFGVRNWRQVGGKNNASICMVYTNSVHTYWYKPYVNHHCMWMFICLLPTFTYHGDFPVSYVSHYQRVVVNQVTLSFGGQESCITWDIDPWNHESWLRGMIPAYSLKMSEFSLAGDHRIASGSNPIIYSL